MQSPYAGLYQSVEEASHALYITGSRKGWYTQDRLVYFWKTAQGWNWKLHLLHMLEMKNFSEMQMLSTTAQHLQKSGFKTRKAAVEYVDITLAQVPIQTSPLTKDIKQYALKDTSIVLIKTDGALPWRFKIWEATYKDLYMLTDFAFQTRKQTLQHLFEIGIL